MLLLIARKSPINLGVSYRLLEYDGKEAVYAASKYLSYPYDDKEGNAIREFLRLNNNRALVREALCQAGLQAKGHNRVYIFFALTKDLEDTRGAIELYRMLQKSNEYQDTLCPFFFSRLFRPPLDDDKLNSIEIMRRDKQWNLPEETIAQWAYEIYGNNPQTRPAEPNSR